MTLVTAGRLPITFPSFNPKANPIAIPCVPRVEINEGIFITETKNPLRKPKNTAVNTAKRQAIGRGDIHLNHGPGHDHSGKRHNCSGGKIHTACDLHDNDTHAQDHQKCTLTGKAQSILHRQEVWSSNRKKDQHHNKNYIDWLDLLTKRLLKIWCLIWFALLHSHRASQNFFGIDPFGEFTGNCSFMHHINSVAHSQDFRKI